MSSAVIVLDQSTIMQLEKLLLKYNPEFTKTNSSSVFRMDSAVITIYKSGKVLIQGKDFKYWADLIIRELNISDKDDCVNEEIANQSGLSSIWPRIGSDESGKGDFFGPLVTAAFLINSEKVEQVLYEIGVMDSKKLGDSKILNLSLQVEKLGPFNIVKINPLKYNELYSRMKNLNKLLGWSHARAIENLLIDNPSCNLAVADQFGDKKVIQDALLKNGKEIKLVQMHKGERDLAVAAASILARAAFLRSIKQLSSHANIDIPLGAGPEVISVGRTLYKSKGASYLSEVAKVHFKTYENIINS